MKRIGIECESIEGKNPVWGIGRIITKLLEEISNRPELIKDYRFILYFKDSIPDISFLKSPIFEKKVVPVPFSPNRLFPIYYFALLPLKLWFEKLDYMFWPNYMLPLIAPGKNITILTEDVYHEAHNKDLPFRYRLAYLIFAWWSAKHSTKIIAISETSKLNIARLYRIDSSRISTNYLGLDHPSKPLVGNLGGEYFLYVGQAFPRRHLCETLLAFEKIAPQYPNINFIAIGPDKYRPPIIKKLVSEINKRLNREAVTHLDYVTDKELKNLYQKACALIYVSDREAFGLPPMEALSFGVPPIIADNNLGHELFSDYAFFVAKPEPTEIAEGLRFALTDRLKIQTINNNGPIFTKKYNWPSFVDRFLSLIN